MTATGRTTRQVASDPSVPQIEDLVRIVALDGPAGTGKSSVARGVAASLGWRFVDTGATYRAATLAVQQAAVPCEDPDAVTEVVAGSRIHLLTDPSRPGVLLDGEDVAQEIRSARVTASVSAVSAVPAVRRLMVAVQRDAAGITGAVVEGRDIATVVAPRAGVKVYLDARPEVRAARRARELRGDAAPGATQSEESSVAAALMHRDTLDNKMNRLQVSEGAVHLDTSDLTLDQVVAHIVGLVTERHA